MANDKEVYVDHVRVRTTPRQAMNRAVRAVVSFFSLSNIKHGLRSVTRGAREYAVFFLALTIVQLMYWFPMLAMESRLLSIREESYSAADYHILMDGMTSDDWSSYYNDTFIINDTYEVEDRLYESYEYEKYINGSGRVCYELKLRMNTDERSDAELFLLRYPPQGADINIVFSPRLTYTEECSRIRAVFFPIMLVLGLLSALILLILYNIRLNHQKFRYGIYMSFGAGFEKLFHTAAWELSAIALLTFLPSLALALSAEAMLCRINGSSFCFSLRALLLAPIWIFPVILLAVFPPVKLMAVKTPVSLIVAGDNSNYVSSPRASFRIFRKNFPIHYELFGFWRFRRYYAVLLASAVAFASLFLCGSFIKGMVRTSEEAELPGLTLSTSSEEGIDPLLLEEIAEAEGVEYVSWERSLDATAVNACVLLNRRQSAGISSKTVKSDDGRYADNNYKYCVIDEALCSQVIRENGWSIEGDLSRVINEENCIAVSEYINNKRALDFKVGDKITVCVFMGSDTPISYNVPNIKYILNQLVHHASFELVELEVAAIVDNGDIDDRYMIGLSEESFESIVGRSVNAESANIYLCADLGYEEAEKVFEKVRSSISTFDSVALTNKQIILQRSLTRRSSFTSMVLACSILILLIVPCVWYYSQSMFGSKRKDENYMLAVFGANDARLGRLYAFSGCALAVPAALATALLGMGVSRLIYSFVNSFLTSLGMGAAFRYEYELSLAGVLICIVLSAVCSVVSTYLPFLKWKRERDRTAALHLGE